MTDEQFILCQDDFGNYEIRYADKVFHFLWEVAPILNEQQATIRRDEISIKTMMSNMEKLEKKNKKLKEEIEPLVLLCLLFIVAVIVPYIIYGG